MATQECDVASSTSGRIQQIQDTCKEVQALTIQEIEVLSSEIQKLLAENATNIKSLNQSIPALEGRKDILVMESSSITNMRQERQKLINDGNALRGCLDKLNTRLRELKAA